MNSSDALEEGARFRSLIGNFLSNHASLHRLRSDLTNLVDRAAIPILAGSGMSVEEETQFVERCRENGINVPIIPGLKPLASKKQLIALPKIFNIDLPEALTNEVEKCKTDKEVVEIGNQWAIEQCKELMKADVPVLHFYTMGKSAQTEAICQAIF